MERRDEELYGLARSAVEGMGFVLVGVDDVVEHGRRVFRFYIDHPRGVDVDDCASVSREIEYLLDARFDFEAHYVLEVSSPGLDHRLRQEREYAHFEGRRARLVLHTPVDGRNAVEGVIEDAKDGEVSLRLPDGEEIEVPLSNVVRANLLP